MTETKILRQIVQKMEELIKYFKSSYYHDSIAFRYGNFFFSRKVKKIEKELADLKKQLEECEDECVHPYAAVHTTCMGEINTCLKCGKKL